MHINEVCRYAKYVYDKHYATLYCTVIHVHIHLISHKIANHIVILMYTLSVNLLQKSHFRPIVSDSREKKSKIER